MSEMPTVNEVPESLRESLPLSVERLAEMTSQEVDDLPYGFVMLDEEGVVLLYNRYEQRMSRLPSERVVGRNFFQEIAPCTRVEAFLGRFRALAQQPPGATDQFSFRFHFLHGAQDVFVQFARAPVNRVFMTVHRMPIEDDAHERPPTIRHERERGRLNGPLGAMFPLAWDQVAALLARVGQSAARELGRSVGRKIAGVAEHTVVEAGAAALDKAPVLLAVGALDQALAELGMGRLAADFCANPPRVACFVRPPVESGSVELSSFYEGLLETTISAALNAAHVARCIEGTELAALPWRFVVVPIERAGELRALGGERPDDLAKRFGLLESSSRVGGASFRGTNTDS
ncbi:PAS domain-containing protein [Sorangium sp. So ce131]|uniref:PAS domain-containing protein n=1 Tax=Sorangium sp. So ce131 TaxID=3133282 RepID=UPI003F5E68FC